MPFRPRKGTCKRYNIGEFVGMKDRIWKVLSGPIRRASDLVYINQFIGNSNPRDTSFRAPVRVETLPQRLPLRMRSTRNRFIRGAADNAVRRMQLVWGPRACKLRGDFGFQKERKLFLRMP